MSGPHPERRPRFKRRPPSLETLLDTSLGVAFYDKHFCCIASNGAFAHMTGVSRKAQVGKTIRQTLGKDASLFEPAFHQVWASRQPLSDVEFMVRLPGKSQPVHWILDFYPVIDLDRETCAIGVVFSELTFRDNLWRRLSRLTEECFFGPPAHSSPLPAEFAHLSAWSVRVLQESAVQLNCFISIRRLVSQRRIASLFATLDGDTWSLSTAPQHPEPDVDLPAWPVQSPEDAPLGPCPSPRERQVVRLLAEGKTNKEIAAFLDLSTRTVETYRARLMSKLDLHSLADIVRYAIRQGIIPA